MENRRYSRADLHVHSKHSDRPSEWFLRRIGAPECFVEPLDLYERARRSGMDFVTIADHNSIAGALEIAHLPGTFLSSEITTYFPEDGCKIHCLVTGITEEEFGAIQELRANIYDLHQYLVDQEIICSITHPLFRVNDRLHVDHVEKLLMMFKRFEGINGARLRHGAELIQAVCRSLTPEAMYRMAQRHGMEPTGPEPWRKYFTAGSDDHSGLYIGSAWTATAPADDVDEFLAYLRRGDHQPAGSCGSSLTLGHSVYQIASSYYKARFLEEDRNRSVLGQLLAKLLDEGQERGESRLASYLPRFVTNVFAQRRKRQLSEIERMLVDEFSGLVLSQEKSTASGPMADRRMFRSTSHIAHTLCFSFLRKFAEHIREGRLLDSLQTIASLAPVAMGVAPYMAAFANQHRDNVFLQNIAAHFQVPDSLGASRSRKAWITDTFSDVNGVARTIQTLGQIAKDRGRSLTVLTCLDKLPKLKIDLKNFRPVGQFSLPEYELQELCFPPFLDVIEYIERQEFGELIISTPGPLGLTALAAAKMLRLPTTSIYHTDFPLIVRHLTHDHMLEQLTWKYMTWFYSLTDRILVPSEYYHRHLIDNGFEASKLSVMVRGVDLDQFNPAHCDDAFWSRRGLPEGFTFLYAGRVSPDKSVDILLQAFVQLAQRMPHVNLAVVGDGPSLASLRRQFVHPRILFTGFLQGKELSQAYASSDVLVFPSTTDTFGNVVLEAQASGLPAIVTNRGGPPDIVARHRSGIILDSCTPDAFCTAMARIVEDPEACARLREAALCNARDSSWEQVLDGFWRDDVTYSGPDSAPGAMRAADETALGLIDLGVA